GGMTGAAATQVMNRRAHSRAVEDQKLLRLISLLLHALRIGIFDQLRRFGIGGSAQRSAQLGGGAGERRTRARLRAVVGRLARCTLVSRRGAGSRLPGAGWLPGCRRLLSACGGLLGAFGLAQPGLLFGPFHAI